MRISRTRHIKVNMGNWENFEFGATITLDHTDLGYDEDDVKEMGPDKMRTLLREKCLEYLADELREDIADAAALTDEDKSFVLISFGLNEDKPAKKTSSRKATRRDR